jgi:hypothetical protein
MQQQLETALRAIRIISVDVANLSNQCAMFRAQLEEAQELAEQIDTRLWDTRVIPGEVAEEAGSVEYVMPPQQYELVLRLLHLLS